jgi:RNA polymerase sigma factor (sigma-70 family)
MDEVNPIPELLKRLQGGDAQAAAQLFERYAQQLTRLAEQHLSRKVAARLGGEDVVQSVFRTFFRRCALGEFRIDHSAQLWQLLVTITLRKAGAKGRHHTAERRDVGGEAPGGADAWLREAVSREPDPAEAAELVDQIEALLRGLPPLYCEVLQMRLEGRAVFDIAVRLGVARQTVYRALHLFQRRLGAAP